MGEAITVVPPTVLTCLGVSSGEDGPCLLPIVHHLKPLLFQLRLDSAGGRKVAHNILIEVLPKMPAQHNTSLDITAREPHEDVPPTREQHGDPPLQVRGSIHPLIHTLYCGSQT